MSKYSVVLSNVGECCDRYVVSGYSKPFTTEELFENIAKIPQITGVELVAGRHLNEKNLSQVKRLLTENNLQLVSIIPDNSCQMQWGKGAFSSKDFTIREASIAHTKEMMDMAVELGGNLVSIWPGQDGYDYYFQSDYIQERTWMEEGLRLSCDYRKDVQVAIEYKPKEPRNHSYASTVYSTLLMVNAIDRANCGVTIDYGHGLMGYENIAESVAVLKKHGNKLMHIHMNDNYGFWDDDMIAGSIHTIPYLEFFYWLERTGYNGWISMDQYPYRENGTQAVQESVLWLQGFEKMLHQISSEEIEAVIHNGDATQASRLMRKVILGNLK